MALEEVATFIRTYRGRYTDEEIRGHLAQQGVAPEEIEEAFRLAAPPPAPRRILRKVLLVSAGVAFAGFVLVLGAFELAYKSRRRAKAEPDPCGFSKDQVATFGRAGDSYAPARLSEPSTLRRVFIGMRAEGSGTEELKGALSMLQGSPGDSGAAAGAWDLAARGAARTACGLDDALRPPKSRKAIAENIRDVSQLAKLADARIKGVRALLRERQPAAAEVELRNLLALADCMMSSWDPAAQGLGGTLVPSALLLWGEVRKQQGRFCDLALRMDMIKAAKESAAYVDNRPEVREMSSAARRSDFSRFAGYLETDSRASQLGYFALFAAAETWSLEERRAATPSPARREFLAFAAGHSSTRVAWFGRHFESVLGEVQGYLASMPVGEREAAKEMFAGMSRPR